MELCHWSVAIHLLLEMKKKVESPTAVSELNWSVRLITT